MIASRTPTWKPSTWCCWISRAGTKSAIELLVGAEIGPVLAFARRLAARKRPVWLRYVLVPGLTDYPADIQHLAEFAGGLGNVERVDVLPFHQMGAHKWKQLGLEYKLRDVEPPTQALVDLACAQFRAAGLSVF